MSKQYPGGIISKTAPTPSGSFENSTAPGIWTLEQQAYWQKLGQWPIPGNTQNFIEDVFSTYLYTGTNPPTATQTVVNGIDLAGKGGLVWIKPRNAAEAHILSNTATGVNNFLQSQSNSENSVGTNWLTAFNSNGFTVGNNINAAIWNLVSWTWRKQAKFFDIVTYTGNGTAGRTIAHNLGSVPGCIIVKQLGGGSTGGVNNWFVYHRSLGGTKYLGLDGTFAAVTSSSPWNNTDPTSTVFTIGGTSDCNDSGGTYIAYLFAHDAGGFGLTGTDNVISCGSFTLDGSGNATVSLGYEPQWVMIKKTSAAEDWYINDTMRGLPIPAANKYLSPNTSAAEGGGAAIAPTSTGLAITGLSTSGSTYIYIAIRRGPMAVPTLGTSVFSPIAYTGNSTTNTTVQNLTTSFAGDATIIQQRDGGNNPLVFDKLRGSTQGLYTSLTLAEENISTARPGQSVGFNNTQTVLTGRFTNQGNYNSSATPFVGWNFKRAPSFFDEVCYTGNGTFANRTHNLTVAPEIAITKRRSGVSQWVVIYPITSTTGNYLTLETTAAANFWGSTGFTTTQFGVAEDTSAQTYVTYLFATCAGVSKVGTYTGNGTTQTIDCGFTGGARFVLIKRTDSTGDWYVWDTARGMTVLTDPYLQLNNTNAEVATLGSVTTVSTGFAVNNAILAGINAASPAAYIFLAIA